MCSCICFGQSEALQGEKVDESGRRGWKLEPCLRVRGEGATTGRASGNALKSLSAAERRLLKLFLRGFLEERLSESSRQDRSYQPGDLQEIWFIYISFIQ